MFESSFRRELCLNPLSPPMCLHLAVVGELACPIDPMCLPMGENYISGGSWDRDQTKRDTTCCSAGKTEDSSQNQANDPKNLSPDITSKAPIRGVWLNVSKP